MKKIEPPPPRRVLPDLSKLRKRFPYHWTHGRPAFATMHTKARRQGVKLISRVHPDDPNIIVYWRV